MQECIVRGFFRVDRQKEVNTKKAKGSVSLYRSTDSVDKSFVVLLINLNNFIGK